MPRTSSGTTGRRVGPSLGTGLISDSPGLAEAQGKAASLLGSIGTTLDRYKPDEMLSGADLRIALTYIGALASEIESYRKTSAHLLREQREFQQQMQRQSEKLQRAIALARRGARPGGAPVRRSELDGLVAAAIRIFIGAAVGAITGGLVAGLAIQSVVASKIAEGVIGGVCGAVAGEVGNSLAGRKK